MKKHCIRSGVFAIVIITAFFGVDIYGAEKKSSIKTEDTKRIMTYEDYLTDGELINSEELLETQEEDVEEKAQAGGFEAKKSDWNLILVNKQNPVPEGYEPQLKAINESMQIDKRIVGSLSKMLEAAKDDGIDLVICSAYRSFERQTTLFESKMDKLMKQGLSYFDAYRTASYSVTIPGTSEHQLGLALDIITPDYTALDSGFAQTEAGKWLKENSSDYGFILRYPLEKEYITGIIFEPWHFRYVGVENAKYITENDLVLEEYIEMLQ